jgi:hypothetical protein
MNDEQIRQLLQRLGIVLECPKCGHKYDLEDISLRSYSGSTYQLRLVCNFCHTPVTASISISGNLKNLAESFIDTRPGNQKPIDIKKTKIKSKITNDDIIDMHQFLKDFDGNFENIFEN